VEEVWRTFFPSPPTCLTVLILRTPRENDDQPTPIERMGEAEQRRRIGRVKREG